MLLAWVVGGCGEPAPPPPMAGYAEAEFVVVAAPAAGTLRTLPVKKGDAVEAGQVIATLDADAEAIAVAAAEARRARAEAVQSNLRKGRRPNELRAIEQQLAQAQALLAASSSALERNRGLVDQGYLAAIRLEELRAAHERDAARVRELQAQRAFAEEAARVDEIAAAAADARASAAELELARWRQGQRQVAAPVAGHVHDVAYRAGEWVAAGAPLAVLWPPAALKLRFFVPETALARLQVGGTVAVGCDGCPDGLTARVRWISPQAEFTPPVIYSAASRAKLVYAVEAEPGAASPLKPGQPVDVRFDPPAR